jgi:release factor glutamine methyltransferase
MTQHEVWTTVKILAWTKDFLSVKGVENARLEAEWLLCAATGLDRVGLYVNYDKPLNADELARFRDMVSRRSRREPLQHILGTQEFCGFEFNVSPDVLIPRHDTEQLVFETVERSDATASIVDIGTGSGCVAITLAKRLPAATVTATDISPEALAVARSNAVLHSVRPEFIQGSLCTCLTGRTFDMIISNPPYIPTLDIYGLEPEVRDHDPRLALDGGADGLEIYRQLIPSAVDHLHPRGWLLVEIGAGQAADVTELFSSTGRFSEPFVSRDRQGIERVIGAQKRGNI